MNLPQGTTVDALAYYLRGLAYPALGSGDRSHTDAAQRVAAATLRCWDNHEYHIRYGAGTSESANTRHGVYKKVKRDITKEVGISPILLLLPQLLLPIAVQILTALIEQAAGIIADWVADDDPAGRQWMGSAERT